MSVYRDGAPGITTRGPGEPCVHSCVVSYTDEGGRYARCLLCGHETIDGRPIGAGTTQLELVLEFGSDPLSASAQTQPAPACEIADDCPCQTTKD